MCWNRLVAGECYKTGVFVHSRCNMFFHACITIFSSHRFGCCMRFSDEEDDVLIGEEDPPFRDDPNDLNYKPEAERYCICLFKRVSECVRSIYATLCFIVNNR